MITTIPAQPGFDLVILMREEGSLPAAFDYNPIISWVIAAEINEAGEYVSSNAFPVCTDWNCNTNGWHIIRRPDGSIEFEDGPTFLRGDEAKALAYAVERRKRAA